jgi:hypothetical protein
VAADASAIAGHGVDGSDVGAPATRNVGATQPADAAQVAASRNGQPNEDAQSPVIDISTAAVSKSGRSEVHTPTPLEEVAEVLDIDDEAPADRPRGARP